MFVDEIRLAIDASTIGRWSLARPILAWSARVRSHRLGSARMASRCRSKVRRLAAFCTVTDSDWWRDMLSSYLL